MENALADAVVRPGETTRAKVKAASAEQGKENVQLAHSKVALTNAPPEQEKRELNKTPLPRDSDKRVDHVELSDSDAVREGTRSPTGRTGPTGAGIGVAAVSKEQKKNQGTKSLLSDEPQTTEPMKHGQAPAIVEKEELGDSGDETEPTLKFDQEEMSDSD